MTLQEMAEESRTDDRYTWPGGLGAVTKKLADILQPKHKDRMQTGATTVAVVSEKEEVQVTYMLGGELKTVAAKAVIMATPKFITRRIVDGLPDKQSEAMHQIRYIPYPVVNLIFDKPVFNHGYDTWCPGNTFTDFVVADWVIQKQAGLQAEVQHPQLLHADDGRESRLPVERNRRAQDCRQCAARLPEADARIEC